MSHFQQLRSASSRRGTSTRLAGAAVVLLLLGAPAVGLAEEVASFGARADGSLSPDFVTTKAGIPLTSSGTAMVFHSNGSQASEYPAGFTTVPTPLSTPFSSVTLVVASHTFAPASLQWDVEVRNGTTGELIVQATGLSINNIPLDGVPQSAPPVQHCQGDTAGTTLQITLAPPLHAVFVGPSDDLQLIITPTFTSAPLDVCVDFKGFFTGLGLVVEPVPVPEADLSVSSFSCSAPAEVDLGSLTSVGCSATVVNNGPGVVASASLTTAGSGPADCTVSGETVSGIGLAVGVATAVPVGVEIACLEPSPHTFVLSAEVSSELLDPDPTNNSMATGATLAVIAQADLAILGWDVPPWLPLGPGERVFFETLKSLIDNGPFGPVGADVWKTLDVPPGAEGSVHVTAPGGERVSVPAGVPYRVIDPAGNEVGAGSAGLDADLGPSHVVEVEGTAGVDDPELEVHFEVADLYVGVQADVVEEFDLRCLEPGDLVATLSNEVQPRDPHVEDLDQSNNRIELEVASLCVAIDIKPRSDPNAVNKGSKGKIPVAILSSEDFDAPGEIDTASLTFGPVGDEESLSHCNPAGEDVNDDLLPDLVCHFERSSARFECGDTVGILRGQTLDGVPIQSSDSVKVVPCN
jgi:hypothetical protein